MANIKKIKLVDNSEYDIVDASATHIQTVTLAQWNLLTPEQQASGDYVVTGVSTVSLDASLVPYDNTSSGLAADDVQEALDELAQGGGGGTAATTTYDNTQVSPSSLRLSATDVQNAIDEVVERTWEGTQAQYNAITTKDPNTIYYVTDGVLSADCFSIVNGAVNITFDDGT